MKSGTKALLIVIGVIVVIFIIVGIAGGGGEKATTSEQPIQEEETETPRQEESSKKEVEYRIIEEDDVSYAGCKRLAIRIVVPDNSDKENVEYTMEMIIEGKKSKWDDITVWAWKYSEEKQVGKIIATMGQKEYSTCQ